MVTVAFGRTKMEELGRKLFGADVSVNSEELTVENGTFIPPDNGSVEVIFKEAPLDETEHPKLLKLDDSKIKLHQICRGCLMITDVSNMQETCTGASITLYENILNIKIEMRNIPATICTNCTRELRKTDKFIKMLRRSYEVLASATKELELLSDQKTKHVEKYNLKKINILRRILQEKSEQSGMEDRKLELGQEGSEDTLSTVSADSPCYDSESSDDEIPLSTRFNINFKKRKKDNRNQKKDIQNEGENKKFVKRQDHLDSCHDRTISGSERQKTLSQNKESLSVPDTCPLCSKKMRSLQKHFLSAHSLNWSDSSCSKCSYENTDKDKLIEHCRECEFKIHYPDFLGETQLKLEYDEEVDDGDEGDPDFELDDPDRSDLNELENDEKEDVKKFTNPYKIIGRIRKFICNKCENVIFYRYKDIESHLKAVHGTETNCILCEQEFNNPFSLLYHMMVKHGKLKCCRLCLVSFRNSEELNTHYKSDEHNTKCTVCEEQFKNRKALYEHRRKKHLNPQLENQKYKCPECPKEFVSQNNIRRHIMVAHNDLRFLCDTCGQSYTTKRNLRLHIQKFHEGVQVQNRNTKKNFFCEACGRELKIFHKYAIAMHMAKHRGHNFVCKKCYDSFPTEQEFKQHVEDLAHQLYECTKCPSQFVREENFKIHLKNHDAPGWNKNMFATWGKSAQLRNEKGEFVCSYCPKVFKDKQRLDNHERVHTNERPYKCHICSKGFKTWIHRKTHLNIHLGIKKWICKFCSKAFTNSCTLKGHEMIHTGERPHRCSECKKGFITMSAMKKHRMVHFKTVDANYGKKDKTDKKNEDKTDSEHEVDFMYKYGRMFTGSEVSYDSFTESKGPPVDLVSIEKELSC